MNLFKLIKIAFVLCLVFLGYIYLESRWLKIKTIEIESEDIPASFNGQKFIFITDIHHGPFFSLKRVKRMVKTINSISPNAVLMGGDYVHRDTAYIDPFFGALKDLDSTFETFAVLGNHDHWEDKEKIEYMMRKNNICICDNASYWLKSGNDSIKIGGVGDLWEDRQLLYKTTYDVEEDDFVILLTHNPDYLEEMNTKKIDLALAGHTHGGQMTFFGLWAPVLPIKAGQKFRYGLKTINNMKAYISSGVGTITPPLRFFCRPEIVVVQLKEV